MDWKLCNGTFSAAPGCGLDFCTQPHGQQPRFCSGQAGSSDPSRAILHSRCSSQRWAEINYEHWLPYHGARTPKSSKLSSDCPYLHSKEALEAVFLVQKAFSLQEQPAFFFFFFSRTVTPSWLSSHAAFSPSNGAGKYTYQYKGFRKKMDYVQPPRAKPAE